MSALDILWVSHCAQWVLLLHHLLRCRDIRQDLYRLQIHTGLKKP